VLKRAENIRLKYIISYIPYLSLFLSYPNLLTLLQNLFNFQIFNFKNWLKSAEKGWKYQAEIYYIIYTIPFSFSIFSQSSMDFSAIFNLFWIFCNKLFWQSLHRLLKLKTSGKDKTFNFKNWLKSAEKGWKYQAEIYYIIYSIPFSFSIWYGMVYMK